jgi:transposase
MITNDIKDPIKALEIYRRKDIVEKSFDNLKNDLDCKRLRIHSAQTMDGRLFIQFIALIMAEKIQYNAYWFSKTNSRAVWVEYLNLCIKKSVF